MTQLHLVVSHRLPLGEATKRIKALFKELKIQPGSGAGHLRQTWKQGIGFVSFKERSATLQGVVVVSDDSVVIAGDLPWTAGILRRRIESTLRKRKSK